MLHLLSALHSGSPITAPSKCSQSSEFQQLDKKKVISRDLRPSNRHAMRLYLEQVDAAAKIAREEKSERKVSMLQTILQTGLDIILPLKSKTVYANEPPWINPTLKKLIKKRQRALNQGDHAEFKLLRNRVNRERKICRSKYYECRVHHLKKCSPAMGWDWVTYSLVPGTTC